MDLSRKQELEPLFGLIKKLKTESDGLVGTQNVLEHIRDEDRIYNAPPYITDAVNEQLKVVFPNPTYPATQERVVGLIDESFSPTLDIEDNDIEYKNRQLLASLGASFFYPEEYNSSEEDRKVLRYLLPIFLEANNQGISKDEELGEIIALTIQNEYQKVRGKIHVTRETELDWLIEDLSREARNTDWATLLSTNSINYELTRKSAETTREKFNIYEMRKRVDREQVEHRSKYRIGILRHVIYQWLNRDPLEQMFLGRLPQEKSWRAFACYYDARIRSHVNLLEKLQRIKRGEEKAIDEIEALPSFSIDWQIEKAQDTLDTDIFVRRLIGQEKTYIEKLFGERKPRPN